MIEHQKLRHPGTRPGLPSGIWPYGRLDSGMSSRGVPQGLSVRLVGARGFEPPTPCSQGRCANQSALRPAILSVAPITQLWSNGNEEVPISTRLD
jgi:hypothetical protein